MQDSYIPKASEGEYCDGIKLCSVRKNSDGVNTVGIKYLDGKVQEDKLANVIDEDIYNGKKIVRVYSSGHVFIDETRTKVFLITTEKNGIIQHQFTGGSPVEEENREVIYKENGKYKFDLSKVSENANIRTKIRTGVTVLENYNQNPIVDWVLIEKNENNEIYYKLVCLIHFVVKKYEGILSCTGKEDTIEGKWYNIQDLLTLENVAPNAYIVAKKSLELLK